MLAWKEELILGMEQLSRSLPLADWIGAEIRSIRKSEMGYDIFCGKGEFIKYVWNNNEPKYLSIVNEQVWSGEEYWLGKYPFVEPIDRGSQRQDQLHYTANNKLLPKLCNISDGVGIYISHNNHYGHFVIDDLPRLALAKCYIDGPVTYIDNPSASILREILGFSSVLPQIRDIAKSSQRDCKDIGFCGHIKTERIFDIRFDNHYLSAFLAQKVVRNEVQSFAVRAKQKKRYFMPRLHPYQTRIANYSEVLQTLLEMGFEVLDISTLSLSDTALRINDAELIVCESGSSTIVSALASPQECQLLSLQPLSLFQTPDSAMIHGGLPYVLAFVSKCYFQFGLPISESSIQSSTLSTYNCLELKDNVTRQIKGQD